MLPGVKVMSDGNSKYDDIPNPHEAVRHSASGYVRHAVHVNRIESFWSICKSGYIGVYLKFSTTHLDRYVKEYSARHNVRPLMRSIRWRVSPHVSQVGIYHGRCW